MAKTPKSQKNINFIPSNLAWRRSIDVSEGALFSIMPDGSRKPVEVTCVTVRGSISHHGAGYADADTPQKSPKTADSNIQRIDQAALDPSSDTLEIVYSIGFHDANGKPESCNKEPFREAVDEFLAAAREHNVYEELAERYLWNIVNARALWRNSYGTNKQVSITDLDDGRTVTVDADNAEQTYYPGKEALGEAGEFVARIAKALAGGNIARFTVSMRVTIFPGAFVFPSQNFIDKQDDKSSDKTGKIGTVLSSRTLHGTDIRQGTMHSQKIGNAIRTIDEWHHDEGYGAVPVEAFGWVQRDTVAIRRPKVNDVFTMFNKIQEITAGLGGEEVEAYDQACYLLAMLIRGGVYGVSAKAGKEDARQTAANDAEHPDEAA